MKLEEEIAQKKFRNEHHKVAVNIIYTFSWLTSFHQEFLKPHGITEQQYNILRILRGQHPNPATIKLIRERMLDKMSDASRLVEKLRVKGLAERTVSKKDRRQVDVRITQKGLDLLSKIDQEDGKMDEFMSHVTVEEAKTLNDLLDKLRG
jgi:DNA-binding MarR family transcriptional regulator